MEKRYWIGVASKNHVEIGLAGGFAQICHGKKGPALRPKMGDGLVYYSGKLSFEGGEPYQKFTGIGEIIDDLPHQVEQFEGFMPWRRNVAWLASTDTPIYPLIGRLGFISNKKNWGFQFRFGFLEIGKDDFELIKDAMCTKTVVE